MLTRRTLIFAVLAAGVLTLSTPSGRVLADHHLSGLSGVRSAINLLLLGGEPIDPALLARIRANILLPKPLELANVPDMQHIVDDYLNGEEGKQWAIVLGKAFFWDQGSGSDGTACASCHFQAGADPRSKNQISPGLLNTTPGVDPTQFNFGGPNFQLTAANFPTSREVDDVISSQGVFAGTFVSTAADGGDDNCTITPHPAFQVGGKSVRKVEPRNTPTVIDAVFNHRNFWDGRANNQFNGVDPFGRRSNVMNPIDPVTFEGNGIWIKETAADPFTKVQVQIKHSSLASQAVGPPLSDIEMSCAGRTFPDVGRKMLRRARALRDQRIDPTDSVLGPHAHPFGLGLNQNYTQLIQLAFQPKYWRGEEGNENAPLPDGKGFSQIEGNFSLFWGLALQLYQATLVSHQTPFDAFARGDDHALTNKQLQGLEFFLNPTQGCILCHTGTEFTNASVRVVVTAAEPMERMLMIQVGEVNEPAVYDSGFYNIGVNLTSADMGIGGTVGEIELDFGALPPLVGPVTPIPLCYARQGADGPLVDIEAGAPAVADEENPDQAPAGVVLTGERVACDGALKVPTLRNVTLTAPYFHNGSHGTLKQVMNSYRANMRNRFADENIVNLAPIIPRMTLTEAEDDLVLEFMRALTDKRVQLERAPFDHPELLVHNGHPGNHLSVVDSDNDGRADDIHIVIPAVGALGRNLPPPPFLGLKQ